jgi:hypothetical protein
MRVYKALGWGLEKQILLCGGASWFDFRFFWQKGPQTRMNTHLLFFQNQLISGLGHLIKPRRNKGIIWKIFEFSTPKF